MLATDPHHVESLENLVILSLQSGDADATEGYLQTLARDHPGRAAYRERLASLLQRRGKYGAAIDCYRGLLGALADHSDARHNLARLLQRAGQPDAALHEYRECLRRGIAQPEAVHNNLGILLGDLHRHEAAREALQQALAINPGYAPALFNLGLLEEEHGDMDRAQALFQRVLERDAVHPGALARLANGRRIAGPTDSLVRQMKRSLRRDTTRGLDREDLLYALGKAFDDCGQYRQAFDWYRQANAASRERVGPYDRERLERQVGQLVAHCDAGWLGSVAPVSDAPHVFICGMFRSGSTLVEQVLAAHPQMTPGGELDFFQRTFRPWPEAILDAGPGELRAGGEAYLEHLAASFPGAGRVSNKRPDNVLYLGLIAALFPRARIIDTRRQPLDNCLSLFFQPLEGGQAYANDLGDCGHYYGQYRRLMAHWENLFGERIRTLQYEDLVAGPEPVLRELLAFLELPWDSACLAFHQVPNRVRTASVHQVRQPLYTRSSGRWRHYVNELEGLREWLDRAGLAVAGG